MHESNKPPRFKTNPVEIFIFSVATLFFANSVYSLVYDHTPLYPNTLTPMRSHPLASAKRVPASSPSRAKSKLVSFSVPCDVESTFETFADKVRLQGGLCAFGENSQRKELEADSIQVSNQSNLQNAVVFMDPQAMRYSTDYIPLERGENVLLVEFKPAKKSPALVQKVLIQRQISP